MYKRIKHTGLLVIILFINLSLVGQEYIPDGWYQFRGQNRDGISTEELNWNGNQPELLWKKDLGSGFSELVVSDGTIYTMISEKTDSIHGFEFIAAFNEGNGEEIWRTKVDSIYIDVDGWGDGPRSTTIIDEKNIYGLSGYGKLTALSKKDGQLLWQIDLIKYFGSSTPRWGYATSPLLIDEKIIMEVGGTENRAFMAFNKKDGSVLWSDGNGRPSHDSPLMVTIEGQPQVIFANGRTLYSYSPEGDTLWTYNMPFRSITAMPVLIDENKIFASGVRTPGFFIIEVSGNKPVTLLTGVSMKNDFNSCVYHNGYIYGFHIAAVRCISAETGEVKWSKRGFGKGSLILVDDKLVILSDKGKLAIAEASHEGYRELTSLQAIEGKSWTAPSFVDGKIYIRNLKEMACYKVK